VFVDDLMPNVESAKKLGMIAIRFKTADDLRRRFETLASPRARPMFLLVISESISKPRGLSARAAPEAPPARDILPDMIDKPLYYGLSFATGRHGLGLISGTRSSDIRSSSRRARSARGRRGARK